MNVQFLPSNILNSVENRIDVNSKSEEEIKVLFNQLTNPHEKEAVLHDLMIYGKDRNTLKERNAVKLAGELFIKADGETQQDFLFNLSTADTAGQVFLKLFSDVIFANSLYHQAGKKISGFTAEELEVEKRLAASLRELTKKKD